VTGWAGRALLVAAGAVAARAVLSGLRPRDPRWRRANYRGRTVSLAGGPALAGAATVTAAAAAAGPAAAAAALTAGLGAGAVGLYDDLVGGRPEHREKGFHGHLAALRQGRVTSGTVKIVGIGAASLIAATLLSRRSWSSHATRRGAMIDAVEVALGAGLIAGSANLLNLLDLRPGRALKVGLLVAAPLAAGRSGGLVAGPVGAAAGLLPDDLAERTMLGDCGANALGALLGTALAARTGVVGKAVGLAVVAGLAATSERVSFTRVIARTPGLRELDELGRGQLSAGDQPAG
jgi:UDP-N-acetylmuramyl pentapeptide phosphotransferase/UDP-N-acetylglucosamine-1-phosphate transferase